MSNATQMGPYFHGGAPDLRIGDLIMPGHSRRFHAGCKWCEARERGEAHQGMDGPSARQDQVYFTTHRLYAKHYASLWGRGALYRVEPIGPITISGEDNIASFMAGSCRVVGILDRAVLLTPSERRRLYREWGVADHLAAAARA